MKAEAKRVWVNQPSTLQPQHKLHGTNVLAIDNGDNQTSTIYFLGGKTISQVILNVCLSPGWLQ
jgi:hypothetical protein